MIRVESLHHYYGVKKVLDDIDMRVAHKQFVGIVGPNGSGKSTLLKCIYRTLSPSSGVIRLDEQDLTTIKLQESAKKMSVVAQHNHINFDFIVEDMVMMGRHPYKKSLERNSINDINIVKQALETVGMTKFLKREFSSLSGGEQQRVILARALAQQPECLILDEPTNHLDIKHQLHLLNIIKALNISVMAAVHDLNIALKYCDYIYVMKEGRVVCHGIPRQVVTQKLLFDVFEVESTLHQINGEMHIVYKGAII